MEVVGLILFKGNMIPILYLCFLYFECMLNLGKLIGIKALFAIIEVEWGA